MLKRGLCGPRCRDAAVGRCEPAAVSTGAFDEHVPPFFVSAPPCHFTVSFVRCARSSERGGPLAAQEPPPPHSTAWTTAAAPRRGDAYGTAFSGTIIQAPLQAPPWHGSATPRSPALQLFGR